MASLYRKTVTRTLPKSAKIEDRKGGPVAVWRDRDGKRRSAPLVLNDDGTPKLDAKGQPRIRTKSATVYLKVPGIGEDIPSGCRTEDGARYKLGELVKRAEHLKANILSEAEARTADHQTTPLTEHTKAYVEHLKAKGVTAAHRKTQDARLRALVEGCCFAKLRDMDRAAPEKWLVKQAAAKRDRGAIPLLLPPAEKLLYVLAALVRILDRDLEAANIPKRDDRDRVLDVHALRHTFGSLLSKAGVPLRTAQAAMRHSDPSLTANVYTDPRLLDVSGAVESLPALPLDDAPDTEHQRKTAVAGCEPGSVALSVALNGGNVGLRKATTGNRGEMTASARPQVGAAVSAGFVDGKQALESVGGGGENGRCRTRTCDLIRVKDAL